MTIEKNRVVSIEYVLKDEAGELLDQSSEGEPLTYIHGKGYIIPGLESALEGKSVGDKVNAVIQAKDAYGEYSEDLVSVVAKTNFEPGADIQVGMQFHAQDEEGSRVVTVTEVDEESVTVDGNHPLAGVTLHFDVRIADIREASQEELDRGLSHSCDCGGDCGDDCSEEGCGCGSCH